MKIFFKVLAGLVVLSFFAVAVFLYTFDANRYKEELTGLARTITGRPINIAGNIDISLYPLIAIKIDDVSIDNPPGFSKKTFAKIGEFDIEIEAMPLLQKRLNIEKLVVNNLVADFERNAEGKVNWSDITETPETDGAQSSLGLAGLVIGGIELTNASIGWFDAGTGKHTQISDMKLVTEAVVKGQPLPLTFNAMVESSQPEWQSSVFVKTMLDFSQDSPVINANELKLVIKALLPSSELEDVTVALIADGEVNVETETARLSNARLSALDLVMSGELDIDNIFSVPVIQGPLEVKPFEAQALAEQFNVVIPPMHNADSLKNITLTALFKTDFSTVYLDKIVAIIDESGVNGFLHVAIKDKPVVNYGLEVDKLRFQDYMPVDSETEDDEIPLPVDFIRTGNMNGALDIETVMLGDVELSKFHITSRMENGVLDASPITMMVAESEVKASMRLDANQTPVGEIDIEVGNVDADSSINPLLKNIMGNSALVFEGIVNAGARLAFSGTGFAELQRSAQGEIKIVMDRPIVQGIDLNHSSRAVAADYANRNNFRTRSSFVTEYDPGRKTEFDSLDASFRVSNGKLVNDDLKLVSEAADITGSGNIDFINKKLDYRPVIDMHVENAVDIRDKLRDHPMEYHAQGAFEKISISFNAKKYDLLVGRMMYQESKERRIRQEKSKSGTWQNVINR